MAPAALELVLVPPRTEVNELSTLDADDTGPVAVGVVPAEVEAEPELVEPEAEVEAEAEPEPEEEAPIDAGMLRLVPVPLLISEALNVAVLVALPVAERPAALQT